MVDNVVLVNRLSAFGVTVLKLIALGKSEWPVVLDIA
jgi:hypothetical protein